MPSTEQILKQIEVEKQRILNEVAAANTGKKVRKKEKAPKNFSLYKAIRGETQGSVKGEPTLYKANIEKRDSGARRFIDENVKTTNSQAAIPGQLIMFNYFEPKTREELEYYDAMPCTIFFGSVNTKEGVRVLGFNIHYYPPKLRFKIMDRIFEIFRPIYEKAWANPIKSDISGFDYKTLIKLLQDADLEFGVRMYIPNLMHKITPIPPKYFQKAVFTEGRFKKQTRLQIMKYWKDWITKHSK